MSSCLFNLYLRSKQINKPCPPQGTGCKCNRGTKNGRPPRVKYLASLQMEGSVIHWTQPACSEPLGLTAISRTNFTFLLEKERSALTHLPKYIRWYILNEYIELNGTFSQPHRRHPWNAYMAETQRCWHFFLTTMRWREEYSTNAHCGPLHCRP